MKVQGQGAQATGWACGLGGGGACVGAAETAELRPRVSSTAFGFALCRHAARDRAGLHVVTCKAATSCWPSRVLYAMRVGARDVACFVMGLKRFCGCYSHASAPIAPLHSILRDTATSIIENARGWQSDDDVPVPEPPVPPSASPPLLPARLSGTSGTIPAGVAECQRRPLPLNQIEPCPAGARGRGHRLALLSYTTDAVQDTKYLLKN